MSDFNDDLYTLMMRCLTALLVSMFIIIGATLGSMAGKDISAVCAIMRGVTAEVSK